MEDTKGPFGKKMDNVGISNTWISNAELVV